CGLPLELDSLPDGGERLFARGTGPLGDALSRAGAADAHRGQRLTPPHPSAPDERAQFAQLLPVLPAQHVADVALDTLAVRSLGARSHGPPQNGRCTPCCASSAQTTASTSAPTMPATEPDWTPPARPWLRASSA